jgi:hypothetical protein
MPHRAADARDHVKRATQPTLVASHLPTPAQPPRHRLQGFVSSRLPYPLARVVHPLGPSIHRCVRSGVTEGVGMTAVRFRPIRVDTWSAVAFLNLSRRS